MRGFKYVLIAAFAFLLFSAAPASHAQVSIGIGIGPEPVCAYGYYGYAPYRCAPYGYYGPEWFSGGRFIGAGRWHSGPAFYGHVNRAYDPRFGYRGSFPARGGHFDGRDFHDFHSSHYSDAGGHYHTEAQHSHYAGGDHRR
jgi:hypothetical protein